MSEASSAERLKMPEEGGNDRPTLIRPPPDDPDKAPIENALDVLDLSVIGPVSFTETSILIFLRAGLTMHHLRASSPTRGPCGTPPAPAASTAGP